jgi:hypothetical protein
MRVRAGLSEEQCTASKRARRVHESAGMTTSSDAYRAAPAHDVIPVAPFAIAGGRARALREAIVKRLHHHAEAHGKTPRAIFWCGRFVIVRPVGFLCERDGHLVFTSNS